MAVHLHPETIALHAGWQPQCVGLGSIEGQSELARMMKTDSLNMSITNVSRIK